MAVNLYFLMLFGKTVKEYARLLKEQKADECDLLLKEFFHYSVKTKKHRKQLLRQNANIYEAFWRTWVIIPMNR